jgi:tetratricopeptide (TPR) repeat protein
MSISAMNSGQKTTIIASLCLVLSLAASIVVLRRVDEIRPQATLDEVLYISSPAVLKRASLGYGGLLADIYWTRAVQYYGRKHYDYAKSYNLLSPLLEITTHLDPHLLVAYQFGASFLAPKPPGGAGQPANAVRLIEYGIQNNPDEWRLYYDLGFVYYMELKDYAKAADAFERGSRVPNAHPFLKVMAAQMAQHAGEFETARTLWSATYETTQDRQIRQNAVEHLRALRVDEDVTHLQALVNEYSNAHGAAVNLGELVLAGVLSGIPVDPNGRSYQLTADGRIQVVNPDDFPFITQGLPPGYKPAPPKFHNQP